MFRKNAICYQSINYYYFDSGSASEWRLIASAAPYSLLMLSWARRLLFDTIGQLYIQYSSKRSAETENSNRTSRRYNVYSIDRQISLRSEELRPSSQTVLFESVELLRSRVFIFFIAPFFGFFPAIFWMST